MSAEETRSTTTYRVLARVVTAVEPARDDGAERAVREGLIELGDYVASSPKKAVEKAVEKHGTPGEEGTTMVAIPRGNWHAFPVGRQVKPVYEIGEKLDTGGSQQTLAAVPEPEAD